MPFELSERLLVFSTYSGNSKRSSIVHGHDDFTVAKPAILGPAQVLIQGLA